ncbi:GNAT family N-acetyltransferase [Orbus mooreae]|uniref:GNAT family N-acetyltransferase n=1 Tax=Orbus mooreae TaxID=3074107 RepID=UPI00370D362D
MKSNSKSILIRPVVKSEHPILLELWSGSVSATHRFLTQNDIALLYQQLQAQWLDLVEIWVLEVSTEIVGFIGFDENRVEMLFIEPNHFRKGYGQQLINFAKQRSREIFLDVNEQNPQALAFYQKQGFQSIGRSETDSQGNPFPLLHLRYQ